MMVISEHVRICFIMLLCSYFFFFKQKTAYEMRISDWNSDVCSSDLQHRFVGVSLFKRGWGGDEVQYLPARDLSLNWKYAFTKVFELVRRKMQIGRASCRERVCQYV